MDDETIIVIEGVGVNQTYWKYYHMMDQFRIKN